MKNSQQFCHMNFLNGKDLNLLKIYDLVLLKVSF